MKKRWMSSEISMEAVRLPNYLMKNNLKEEKHLLIR
jgi:hypothetical protein